MPTPSKKSATPTGLSLATLAKLQAKASQKSQMSPTAPTETPTREISGKDGIVQRSKIATTALRNLEDSFGGREAAIDALAYAELDPKQLHFLRLLGDPARANDKVAVIARDAGLLPTQVITLFRSASAAKAHALAMANFEAALPAVARDVAEKSVDSEVICPDCRGDAANIAEGDCPTCRGLGTILRPSDIDHQKLLLEATGVVKKGGGIAIQNIQSMGAGAPGAFFSKFVSSSDKAAYDVVIDAEVKEPDGC